MGKTPKEKVNERRRPYNYLRNTQAQGHFNGNETRNYYYSSGSVQRPVGYHRLHPAAPNQFKRGPFRGELYRDRVSNIPKLGKPHLRKHLANKKIVSPLRRAARRKMQEEQKKEGTGEVIQQEKDQGQQLQSKEEDHNLKNGPSETSNVSEEKEKMENGLAAETNGSEKASEQDSENLDEAPKGKSPSKDKKAKKNETPPKPKGKISPKSSKDKKVESVEVKKSEKVEIEITEVEIETKDKKATKKAKKEMESHQAVSDHTQPTVKVFRVDPQMLATNAEMNDSSIVEIPVDDAEGKQEAVPSTSSEWPSAASRASPRRSTRLQEQKNDSVVIVQKNEPDDSVVVLENESVSVTEVSRSSKTSTVSFAEALSGMRGRRSLRPLPPLNLSSRQHAYPARAPLSVTSNPDPVGQEFKTRSFSSVVHKSSKSVMTTTADNDLDDAANNSCSTEESGTEADGTSSEQSSSAAADVSLSGKRKISNIQLMDEVQHEHKRFRSINEEQMNSTGFLSMIASPMNAFASRIKSGKSSTPLNLMKVSHLAEEDVTEDVSEIIKEQTDQSLEVYNEKKENVVVVQSEVPQKKWCNIM